MTATQWPTTKIDNTPLSGPAKFDAVDQRNKAAYTIGNEEDLPFRIRFIHGPHGGQPLPAFIPEGESGELQYADVTLATLPTAEIMEIPYYSTQAVVMDKPPVVPQVNIVPFKNISNKVMIMLNGSSGETVTHPQPIEDSDLEAIRMQFISQGLLANDSTATNEQIIEMALNSDLTFRSDDPSYRYEIYRTTAPPASYESFKGKKRADIIELMNTKGGNRYATYATYLEDIIPNVKYYYCFRVVDIHGHVSNPTTTYELEMIDNSGQIYLSFKEYFFPTTQQETFKKSGRRFLYIAPTWTQSRFDDAVLPLAVAPDLEEAPPSNVLGTSGIDQIWDKIFKVRLTSKKTGKKVDINLTFKNTGVVIP